MLHWYERVLAPVILGGSVWLYGSMQQQGTGYRVFVKYAAIFMVGLAVIIFTLDLVPQWWANNWPLIAIAWFVVVGWIGWKKHLA